MSFWSGLARVVQGKPVFDIPSSQNSNTGAGEKISGSGEKVIPEVTFEHCKSHLNGSEMEITVWVTNRSQVQIELDKIVLIGVTLELDRLLQPGEAREVCLYRGEVPATDDYHTASLYYKQVNSGDYFQADFMIEYDYDPDGFYTVEEFQPVHPVRDI